MKKLFLPLIVAIAALGACNKPVKGDNGVSYKNAVEYNDYIVLRQTDLMRKVVEFGETAQTDIDSAASLLSSYSRDTEKMIDEIRGMPAFKGDTALRNAAVNSFSFYKRVFEEDYMDIINIRRKGDLTQDDVDEMERIVKKIEREEKVLDDAFQAAQKSFAKENNMRLRENEMQKEMERRMGE